jgi:molybdopterin-guanine dinucleotide biosynthesis protein A
MGRLGRMLPKALLTVSPEQTALSRLLDQLAGAPVDTVVSTSPSDHRWIELFVNRYIGALDRRESSLLVLKNEAHEVGPVSALRDVVSGVPAERYLVCLVDIVFAENPFEGSVRLFSANALVTAPLEQGRGGIIEAHHGRVVRAYYQPEDCELQSGRSYSNWSGAMCVDAANLRMGLKRCPSETLEDVINALVELAPLEEVRMGSDFTNLNTGRDLLKLWSSQAL